MRRNIGPLAFLAVLLVVSVVVTSACVGGDDTPANTNSVVDESVTDTSSEDTSTEDTSSEDSSVETSSEAESSKEISSKETSSKVTSSKETSSKETSSKEASSKETSSKETSSKETVSTTPSELVDDGKTYVAEIDKSKMTALYNKNKDTIGWIKIPNTNIDYGVVKENHYGEYMNLDYNKNYYKGGNVIWADADANFGTRDQLVKNTIIYGHNWTNYSRPIKVGRASDKHFAQLAAYDYLTFAKKNPYISFSTLEEEMYWQIFAVFYVETPKTSYSGTKDFNYIVANPTSLTALANEAISRSIHDFGVTVSESDKILTLSTCTRVYNKQALAAGRSKDQQRFVVMAKLMPKGANLGPVNVTENKDFKPPQF